MYQFRKDRSISNINKVTSEICFLLRRVWKKISAVKLEAGHGGGNGDGGNRYSNYEDSDEEYNEETKWSWYIS